MGRSILLTRTSDGSVKAFDNVCLHRQSQVVTGCGIAKRFPCPYHAWTYDNTGRLVGLPGREGFPEMTLRSDGLTELPAAEFAGLLWVRLDPGATLDIAAHLGPLAGELDSWGIGRWSPLGEKVLDCPINWKLAVDTFSENYHFATVHRQTFATIARSNCTVFDSYGPHHRLIFPLNTILELDECSRRAVGPVPQHGRDLRAVPQHRAVGDHRQRRAVPDLPGRPTGQVDHRAPELDTAGPLRRIRGRRRASRLRVRARHGARRGLPAGRGPASQPRVGRPRSPAVRAQRTGTAAPPHRVGPGACRRQPLVG